MFTGIIEALGSVKEIIKTGPNRSFWIESPISPELRIDQSLSHNGACLTIEKVLNNSHLVTAVNETLQKTNLGNWKPGTIINLERAVMLNARMDGHLVQGHVDTTGSLDTRLDENGSWVLRFRFPGQFAHLLIEKGSVAVEGISLTAFDVNRESFKVAIIPYTHAHTNLRHLELGQSVNIEFDLIGKYVTRSREVGNIDGAFLKG
jgi:riboflavin synthase